MGVAKSTTMESTEFVWSSTVFVAEPGHSGASRATRPIAPKRRPMDLRHFRAGNPWPGELLACQRAIDRPPDPIGASIGTNSGSPISGHAVGLGAARGFHAGALAAQASRDRLRLGRLWLFQDFCAQRRGKGAQKYGEASARRPMIR